MASRTFQSRKCFLYSNMNFTFLNRRTQVGIRQRSGVFFASFLRKREDDGWK
jgi:hypothetical protein